jgi:peptidoglycan/xylan/chitin deacetylase (PgdA/CDA1 family)
LKPEAITAADLSIHNRHVLLTFDDGGVSAASHAAPILEEFGWPGHFFVTTDRIGTPGFLEPAQIRDLRRRQHVIGSHSCSHPTRMAACSVAQLDREWRDSVRRLEDILGERVTTASIPGGYYSSRVASSAAAAGIQVLFTSEPVTKTSVVHGCLVVGRFCVQQGVSPQWVAAIVADRAIARLQRTIAWNSKKVLKAAGGSAWLRMRQWILARRADTKKSPMVGAGR